MKSYPTLVAIFTLLVCGLSAQGVAPETLRGVTGVLAVSSGSGFFAPYGAARVSLDNSGTAFSVTPLTNNIFANSGTYTYQKTGAATAVITLRDTTGVSVPYNLTFTTQTSARYSANNTLGSQTGVMVIESGTLTAPPAAGQALANLSVRAIVPAGGQTIPAFVLAAPARVLIRAVGPGLAAFGVPSTLPNPKISLMSGQAVIASNDNWGGSATVASAMQSAGAFSLAPTSLDAALVVDLAAGAYTIPVTGDAGTSGEVLVEVYRL